MSRKKSNGAFVFICFLLLALTLALASCGSSDGGSGESSQEEPSQEAPADENADAADASSQGDTDDTPSDENGATPSGTSGGETIDAGGALNIDTSAVTEQATFYSLTVDDTYMEVFAVRAPDGTVRTAFNTCQVCWDSGRGYYLQEADELVCQNCGNRFKTGDVEILRGGCNPVPITEEYKKIDGDSLSIGYDLLKEAVPLFKEWKS
ncbi:MAG: DUF2318 domain-containing protein [Clostridiales Family XIII bacterium]|jgi:hypothetical protein|nr:DUF2318 domain-containing protein [Clostridiales Family XIII bacterium]